MSASVVVKRRARLHVREAPGADALDEPDLLLAEHHLLVVVRVVDGAQRRARRVRARQQLLQPARRMSNCLCLMLPSLVTAALDWPSSTNARSETNILSLLFIPWGLALQLYALC